MPQVSTDIDSLLTAADATAARAALGAVGTASEINTALEGETLVVDGVQLSDQSDVVLDAGKIAHDENGRAIIGTTGGNVEIGHSSRFKVRNAIHIPTATITAGESYNEIGRFKLRADEWMLGQRAVLIGRLGAVCSATYAGTAIPGVRPDGATTAGFSTIQSVTGTNGASGIMNFVAFVEFKQALASTKIVIDEDESTETMAGILARGHATDVASVIISATSSASNTATNGAEPGDATDLVLYIKTALDAAYTGYIRAFADMEIILL